MTDGPKLLEQAENAARHTVKFGPRVYALGPVDNWPDVCRAVLTALLPRLSEESRARLEKEIER